ncbi:hypothetical protein, partial [Bradyrhizobium sp.]
MSTIVGMAGSVTLGDALCLHDERRDAGPTARVKIFLKRYRSCESDAQIDQLARGLPLSPALPRKVGLSHMGQDGEKEVVAPSCLEHFVAGPRWTWRGLQGVDGELA